MGVCRMQQEGGAPELSRGSDCGTQRAGPGRSLQRPQGGPGARAGLEYRVQPRSSPTTPWATPGRSALSDRALAGPEVWDVAHLCIQVWDFKKLSVVIKKLKSPNKNLAPYQEQCL